jgi:hypothetical protein
MFPRYSLKLLDKYIVKVAEACSSKEMSREDFAQDVFGSGLKGPNEIRISALRQFGLLKEPTKGQLRATKLAVEIAAHPENKRTEPYMKALLKPKIIKDALLTFSGKKTTKEQIGIIATRDLGVHIKEKKAFIKILVESATIAGACKVDKEDVEFTGIDTKPDDDLDVTDEHEGTGESDSELSKLLAARVVVNIKLDSNLSPEILEAHLQKLRDFNLI